MKKLILYISAGIFSGLLACPAYAEDQGGFRINTKALPDASNIERARPRLQIVNTGPIVTDKRIPEQQGDNYILNVQPLQPTPGNTYVIGNPNGGGGGYVNLNGIAPNSDMHRSNINPGAFAPKGLLPGNTTGVHGPRGSAAGLDQRLVNGRINPAQNSSPLQTQALPAKGYHDYHSAGQSAGGPIMQSNVHGEIRNQPNVLRSRVLQK